jgi:hypothetical protein
MVLTGICVLLCLATVFADAVLVWNPPTTNADGTFLVDLAGYKVYHGTSSLDYTWDADVGNVTTYKIDGLTPEITYFFAVTAYDTSGNESEFSNEVSLTRYFLDVNKQGSGSGTVTSSPPGIDCGTDCSELYNVGRIITFSVIPDMGSQFNGWSGARCSGNGQCILTITANTVITANFDISPITVTAPAGGERIASGSIYTIQWTSQVEAINFKLLYSLDNGVTWQEITPDPVTGNAYDWTVPAPDMNQRDCLIKVTGYDASGVNAGEGISNTTFTIEVIRVETPLNDGILTSGVYYPIVWLTNATSRSVAESELFYKISLDSTEIDTDIEDNWIPITILPGNPGFYLWEVPFVSSNTCKVKVKLKDAAGETIAKDKNNGTFTIQPYQY